MKCIVRWGWAAAGLTSVDWECGHVDIPSTAIGAPPTLLSNMYIHIYRDWMNVSTGWWRRRERCRKEVGMSYCDIMLRKTKNEYTIDGNRVDCDGCLAGWRWCLWAAKHESESTFRQWCMYIYVVLRWQGAGLPKGEENDDDEGRLVDAAHALNAWATSLGLSFLSLLWFKQRGMLWKRECREAGRVRSLEDSSTDVGCCWLGTLFAIRLRDWAGGLVKKKRRGRHSRRGCNVCLPCFYVR